MGKRAIDAQVCGRRTRQVTLDPHLTNRSTRCAPIKPVAPVIREGTESRHPVFEPRIVFPFKRRREASWTKPAPRAAQSESPVEISPVAIRFSNTWICLAKHV